MTMAPSAPRVMLWPPMRSGDAGAGADVDIMPALAGTGMALLPSMSRLASLGAMEMVWPSSRTVEAPGVRVVEPIAMLPFGSFVSFWAARRTGSGCTGAGVCNVAPAAMLERGKVLPSMMALASLEATEIVCPFRTVEAPGVRVWSALTTRAPFGALVMGWLLIRMGDWVGDGG